jgi:hypothetical protein
MRHRHSLAHPGLATPLTAGSSLTQNGEEEEEVEEEKEKKEGNMIR